MLASDAFSNNYVFYNVVGGIGLPPALVGALANYVAIPVSFAANAANTAVASALATAIAGVNGTNSFTTSVGGHTVTVTSAASASLALSPAPQDINTGFTVSAITYTTLAKDWAHVGLQPGLTPAVGQAFIAATTGGSLGTGTVIAPGVSGIVSVEVIGDPNASIANSNIAANGGALLLVQFRCSYSEHWGLHFSNGRNGSSCRISCGNELHL